MAGLESEAADPRIEIGGSQLAPLIRRPYRRGKRCPRRARHGEAAEGAGSIVTSINGYAIVLSTRLANERGDDVVIMPEAAAP